LNTLKLLDINRSEVYEAKNNNEIEKIKNYFILEFKSNFNTLCDLKSFIMWPSFLNFFQEIDNDTEVAESFLHAMFMIRNSDEAIRLINLGRDTEDR
jgi:hypothetical protein